MNVQDVVTRVQRIFGDEAAVQVTNADIIRWINDSMIEIVKHNEAALQKTAFVNLVVGQSTYVLPTDLLILRSLRYKYTSMLSFSALKYKSMQQFDESLDGWDGAAFTNAPPQFFTMDEGKAILFPVPDQASINGLKVIYNQKPADVVALVDTLALPILYHNTIVNYCMWQASLLDEDHEPALMYKSGFTEDMARLKDRETTEAVATYSVITVLEGDM